MAMPGCLRHITRSLWVLCVSFLSGRTLGKDLRDLRVMARHFFLLWVRRGEDELMWSCFGGVGGDVGRKEGVERWMGSNCSDLSALWRRAGII